ncbi:hypothetical protein TcasGA2_TC003837 [Tribolium castaneum]|uniref:Uncharacterized protein n=1 Tax=Tribolium castaneum TaxID=7070 RepID=D6WFJ5_TRICA|nr:hypothetical protein TcasGA2_TC003837 [Tribolium castaneum]
MSQQSKPTEEKANDILSNKMIKQADAPKDIAFIQAEACSSSETEVKQPPQPEIILPNTVREEGTVDEEVRGQKRKVEEEGEVDERNEILAEELLHRNAEEELLKTKIDELKREQEKAKRTRLEVASILEDMVEEENRCNNLLKIINTYNFLVYSNT